MIPPTAPVVAHSHCAAMSCWGVCPANSGGCSGPSNQYCSTTLSRSSELAFWMLRTLWSGGSTGAGRVGI